MSLTIEYWYLFPMSILIATIAMASGIGGAVFFSPLFMIVLKLEPSVAIGTALTTELFGFSSGLFAYWRRGFIDFKLGRDLLLFSVPAAIVGSFTAEAFPAAVLKTIFGVGIIFIGSQMYSSLKHKKSGKNWTKRSTEKPCDNASQGSRTARATSIAIPFDARVRGGCSRRSAERFSERYRSAWPNSRSTTSWCVVGCHHPWP